MAEAVEEAGFDGAWLTDHVVLVDRPSPYPYSAGGSFFVSAETEWYESVTSLAAMAARTEQVELGIGVLVLPLRNPVVLAKQLATIDQVSGGRVHLAVGPDGCGRRLVTLGLDPRERGPRTDAAIGGLRTCWSGAPTAGTYGPFTILTEVLIPADHCIGPGARWFRSLMRTLVEGRIILSTVRLLYRTRVRDRAHGGRDRCRAAADPPRGPRAHGRSGQLGGGEQGQVLRQYPAQRATTEALHIHGGWGYTAEFPVERLYRDAPESVIGEETGEIQLRVISRALGVS